MEVKLELKTVQDIEKILREGEPSHRRDSLKLLLKWRDEVGLEKDLETEQLIERLITEYHATGE
jgi:hypothetical protein